MALPFYNCESTASLTRMNTAVETTTAHRERPSFSSLYARLSPGVQQPVPGRFPSTPPLLPLAALHIAATLALVVNCWDECRRGLSWCLVPLWYCFFTPTTITTLIASPLVVITQCRFRFGEWSQLLLWECDRDREQGNRLIASRLVVRYTM